MTSPERFATLVRLFAPLIIGVVLLVIGVLQANWAVVAIGAGVFGVPGLSGTLTAHREGQEPGR